MSSAHRETRSAMREQFESVDSGESGTAAPLHAPSESSTSSTDEVVFPTAGSQIIIERLGRVGRLPAHSMRMIPATI